jgi:coenzyme F420 hydrogenase subunit beta
MNSTNTFDFDALQRNVIAKGLCTRCGVCAGVCPVGIIGKDEDGYPIVTGNCISCNKCNLCCPGGDVDFPLLSKQIFGTGYDPLSLTGYVEEMYIANSINNGVREAGSSGGVVTALLLYLLGTGKIQGAIVVGMDEKKPYLSKGILATTADEILAAAGSKYSITPSMEVLSLLRKKEGRFAIVGLPCQIHGLRKLMEVDPQLSGKIYCILGLFCNCNLEPFAAKEAIEIKGIGLADVGRFDYRGGTWPGRFQVTKRNGDKIHLNSLTIKFTMNIMFRLFGARRCYLCVDALAEYADISFGDFWAHDYIGKLAENERCTLVYQRTSVGMTILQDALKNEVIQLQTLPQQRNSIRILNMTREKKQRALLLIWQKSKHGIPIPDYHFEIKKPSFSERRILFIHHFYNLIIKLHLRKPIVKMLFSPPGKVIDGMNSCRKKWFGNYKGN